MRYNNMNKYQKKDETEEKEEKKYQEVKLKSEQYNHNSEFITKREDNDKDIMWGFVLGFILFLILFIFIIIFTH